MSGVPTSPTQAHLEAFGRAVRELRKARGWSQTALGDAIEMDRPNVSRLEAGKHWPKLQTVLALAGAFGLSCADFGRVIDLAFEDVAAD